MIDSVGKYSFKVPATLDHPDAGKKFEKEYDYVQCETVEESEKIATDEGWTLLEFVNEALQNRARGNSYQNALAAYKPSTMSTEQVKARMVRDFIKLGLSEDVAKVQVESMLSANNG